MTGQKDRILRHLRDYGAIDQMEALSEYGIMRLGARIHELRREGYPIISERVEGRNRYGEKCHYARYRMGGEDMKMGHYSAVVFDYNLVRGWT